MKLLSRFFVSLVFLVNCAQAQIGTAPQLSSLNGSTTNPPAFYRFDLYQFNDTLAPKFTVVSKAILKPFKNGVPLKPISLIDSGSGTHYTQVQLVWQHPAHGFLVVLFSKKDTAATVLPEYEIGVYSPESGAQVFRSQPFKNFLGKGYQAYFVAADFIMTQKELWYFKDKQTVTNDGQGLILATPYLYLSVGQTVAVKHIADTRTLATFPLTLS